MEEVSQIRRSTVESAADVALPNDIDKRRSAVLERIESDRRIETLKKLKIDNKKNAAVTIETNDTTDTVEIGSQIHLRSDTFVVVPDVTDSRLVENDSVMISTPAQVTVTKVTRKNTSSLKKSIKKKKTKTNKKKKRKKQRTRASTTPSKISTPAVHRKYVAVTPVSRPTHKMPTPLTDKFLSAILDGRLTMSTGMSMSSIGHDLSHHLNADRDKGSSSGGGSGSGSDGNSVYHLAESEKLSTTPLQNTSPPAPSLSIEEQTVTLPSASQVHISRTGSIHITAAGGADPVQTVSSPVHILEKPLSPMAAALEVELSLERERTKELIMQLDTLKQIQLLKAEAATTAAVTAAEQAAEQQAVNQQLRHQSEAKQAATPTVRSPAVVPVTPVSPSLDTKVADLQPRKSQSQSHALKLYMPPPPDPKSREWENVDTLVRPLPLYTRDRYSQLDALKSVYPLVVAPLLKGNQFVLWNGKNGTKCELRVGGSGRMLHWSMMKEEGMYRGSLLMSNVVSIDVSESNNQFTLSVWQEVGQKCKEQHSSPAKLTFATKDHSMLETWVTGLMFLHDVLPFAGVPFSKSFAV